MFCTNCGKSIPDTANFCAFCGTRIHAPSAVNQNPPPAPTPRLEPTPPALATQKTPSPPLPKPALQMEPVGPAWPRWIWYLVVFALFNVAGRNLGAAVFGHGMLAAISGVGLGIAGAYGAAALLERVNGAGTRMLAGLGVVVAAFVLALIGNVANDFRHPKTQREMVQTNSEPHGPLEAYTPTSQPSQTPTDQAQLKPFSGTIDAQAGTPPTNCTDYASTTIPSQYTGARISINFQSVPIDTFFKLISEESGITIINTNNLDDSVTICAANIPWDYALDTVLSTNGHTRRTIGEAIYIH